MAREGAEPFDVHVVSQPVAKVLNELSKQTGIQVNLTGKPYEAPGKVRESPATAAGYYLKLDTSAPFEIGKPAINPFVRHLTSNCAVI